MRCLGVAIKFIAGHKAWAGCSKSNSISDCSRWQNGAGKGAGTGEGTEAGTREERELKQRQGQGLEQGLGQ